MRTVYEDRALWRQRGLQASAIIREAFSWDAVARQAFGQLQQVRGA